MMLSNAVDFFYFTQTFTLILCQTTGDAGQCGSNTCCSGFYMKDGLCRVCEDGRHGINCSESCREGYFGRLCKSKCPTPCKLTCDKVTGQCSNQTSISDSGLESFLKNNSWVLVIGSSVLMILSFGCIAFLFCHHMCQKREDMQLISEPKHRNVIPGSVKQGKFTPRRSQKILKRNEVSLTFRDEDTGRNKNRKQLIEISTEIKEFTPNSIPGDQNKADQGSTHPCNNKPKYRYSLAKNFEITEEIDISQEFSDSCDSSDSDHDVEYDNIDVEKRFQKKSEGEAVQHMVGP